MKKIFSVMVCIAMIFVASCGGAEYKTFVTPYPTESKWVLFIDGIERTGGSGDTIIVTSFERCISVKLLEANAELYLRMHAERNGGIKAILQGNSDLICESSVSDSGAVALVCRPSYYSGF